MESTHNKEKNVFKTHNNKKPSGAQYRKRKAEKVDNLKKNYKKSMLSIEQDITENLDFSSLIRDFADKKARKVRF